MSDACCSVDLKDREAKSKAYKRVLWIALIINLSMFVLEIAGSARSGSTSLLADAVDFFGDAANYGLSLAVFALSPVWNSRIAVIKGASMGLYGFFVLGQTLWMMFYGVVPEAETMGVIAVLALLANLMVAVLLFKYRDGNANMRAVWLCSRNDALGNIAVMAAAAGVYLSNSRWPDLTVALFMSLLGLSASLQVLRAARKELNSISKV
jgi:Co/Zn/Cd efflux system component